MSGTPPEDNVIHRDEVRDFMQSQIRDMATLAMQAGYAEVSALLSLAAINLEDN